MNIPKIGRYRLYDAVRSKTRTGWRTVKDRPYGLIEVKRVPVYRILRYRCRLCNRDFKRDNLERHWRTELNAEHRRQDRSGPAPVRMPRCCGLVDEALEARIRYNLRARRSRDNRRKAQFEFARREKR